MSEFQVERKALTSSRIVDGLDENSALLPGEIMLRVEQFAFTANNVTYGVAGDQIGYWRFFPPAGLDEKWGVLPVWGFGRIVATTVDELPVGERLYGYFPPASNMKLLVGKMNAGRVTDASPHRADLPAAYNSYSRVAAEPGYHPSQDNFRSLLAPLFVTSFCLWDAMKDADWHGAKRVMILSASSKTSIGLAYALAGDEAAPEVIGVTSARNREMVSKLGIYDQVIGYDEAAVLDSGMPTVIVDMSGNSEALGAFHQHLGDAMVKTWNVGITHWEVPRSREGYILERCEFFFAPGHIQKRNSDWGPDGFAARVGSFMMETMAKAQDWLEIRELDGLSGLTEVYEDVCKGRASPDVGLIVKM